MKTLKIIIASIALPVLFAASAQAAGGCCKKGDDDKKETSILNVDTHCGCDKKQGEEKKDA